jgi:DNA gyrase subunit A
VGKLNEEASELAASVADLSALLASDARVVQRLVDEAQELKATFGTPRRTRLELSGKAHPLASAAPAPAAPAAPAAASTAECLITLSERGYIKRLRPADFGGPAGGAMKRGTRAKPAGRLRADDTLLRVLSCSDSDSLVLFTERGRAFALPAASVPLDSRSAGGTPLPQLCPLAPGEVATALLSVPQLGSECGESSLVMLTQRGWMKRMALSELAGLKSAGLIALKMEPGDCLRFVRLAQPGDHLMLAASDGMVLRFPLDDSQLRLLGRTARGVLSMDLAPGATLVGLDLVPAAALGASPAPAVSADSDDTEGAPLSASAASAPPWALLVTQGGFAKRVPVSLFRVTSRGKKGTSALKVSAKGDAQGDSLASLRVVGLPSAPRASTGRSAAGGGEDEEAPAAGDDEEVLVATANGMMARCRSSAVPIIRTRNAKGWALVKLDEGDKVRVSALLPAYAAELAA